MQAQRWEKKVSASYKFHAGFSGSDSPQDTEPVRAHARCVQRTCISPLPMPNHFILFKAADLSRDRSLSLSLSRIWLETFSNVQENCKFVHFEPSLGGERAKDRSPWARQFTAAIIASYRELYKKRLHATLERGNWPSAVYHRHPVRYTSCTSRLYKGFDSTKGIGIASLRSVRCCTIAKNVDWVANRDVLILPRFSRWEFLKTLRGKENELKESSVTKHF